MLRTLGSGAPDSPTSFGAAPSFPPPPRDNDELMMTTLGPMKLSQHVKELGINRQLSGSVSGTSASASVASADENLEAGNALSVSRLCTFKSKELFGNFAHSLTGDASRPDSRQQQHRPPTAPRSQSSRRRPASAAAVASNAFNASNASAPRRAVTPSTIYNRATPLGELKAATQYAAAAREVETRMDLIPVNPTKWGLAYIARHVITRMLSPRLMIYMAYCDMASDIYTL